MTPRGRPLLALALAGSTAGCTPSFRHLLEARRHADAICLASSAEEAAAVAATVERDAAPSLNLYPVHASELAPVLGEAAARRTLDKVLLLRAQAAHGAVSVNSLDVEVVLKSRSKGSELGSYTPVSALRLDSEGWQALFSLTGERPPPSARTVTVLDEDELKWAVLTLGLSRLFSSKPMTREVEQQTTDEEWAAAGPRAGALARGLAAGGSAQGYLIPEVPGQEIHTAVTLTAADYLNDGGSCELTVWYELAVPPLRPAAAPALDWMFGAQMRPLRELPVRERRYLLSNPFGSWSSSPADGGG